MNEADCHGIAKLGGGGGGGRGVCQNHKFSKLIVTNENKNKKKFLFQDTLTSI